MRNSLSVVFGTLATLTCAVAAAESPVPVEHARLSYIRARGAESCPEQAALAAEVVGRLGYDPFVGTAARALEVSVTNEGGQLRATITLSPEGNGTASVHRLVSSALDCSVLRPALGLAIALAIDPARALAVDDGPAMPAPRPPIAFPQPIEQAPLRPRPSEGERPHFASSSGPTAARSPPHVTVYGGGYAAVAAAPSTTGGLDVGAAKVFRHFSIGGELRGEMPVSAPRGGGKIEVGRVFAEAVPCFRTIAFGFGFCALAAVGLTIARGHGYLVSKDVYLPYAALGARLMVEIPLAPKFAFGLHADLLGLLTRASLRVDATVGYTDAPATGAFGVDFVGRIGDGS